MKLLFLKTETTRELTKANSYEYTHLNMNYKITKTIKIFDFVIYSNSKFTRN